MGHAQAAPPRECRPPFLIKGWLGPKACTGRGARGHGHPVRRRQELVLLTTAATTRPKGGDHARMVQSSAILQTHRQRGAAWICQRSTGVRPMHVGAIRNDRSEGKPANISARFLLGDRHVFVSNRGRLERGRQGTLDLGYLCAYAGEQ